MGPGQVGGLTEKLAGCRAYMCTGDWRGLCLAGVRLLLPRRVVILAGVHMQNFESYATDLPVFPKQVEMQIFM